MKRNAEEMISRFRDVIASQSEDEIANYLEDISDSVTDVDLSKYVKQEEYEKAISERDAAQASARDYRDRYINRFYNPGNNTNDKTWVEGSAPQLEIEKEEKRISYDDLFE